MNLRISRYFVVLATSALCLLGDRLLDRNWNPALRPPEGLNGPVTVLGDFGGRLLAGGTFTKAHGEVCRGIAIWDGERWREFQGGVDGLVRTIAVQGNQVWVGGNFRSAGGVAARNLARWLGTRWEGFAVGAYNPTNDIHSQVNALIVQGQDLYIGGDFDRVETVTANNIARLTRFGWEALGTGITAGTITTTPLAIYERPYVDCMKWFGNGLWVGGRFGSAGGRIRSGLACWRLGGWTDLGGLTGEAVGQDSDGRTVRDEMITAMAASTSQLVVSGRFTAVGGVAASSCATLIGGRWQALNIPGLRTAAALDFPSAETLFVSGLFNSGSNGVRSAILRQQGSTWEELPSGPGGAVSSVISWSGGLAACGLFHQLGDGGAAHVAAYRDGVWNALPESGRPGLGIGVMSMQSFQDSIWLTALSVSPASDADAVLFKWDGSRLHPVRGVEAKSQVGLVATADLLFLYSPTELTTPFGDRTIIAWDGRDWRDVQGDLRGAPFVMSSTDGGPVVFGAFERFFPGATNAALYPSVFRRVDGQWREIVLPGGELPTSFTGFGSRECVARFVYNPADRSAGNARHTLHRRTGSDGAWEAIPGEIVLEGYNRHRPQIGISRDGDILIAGDLVSVNGLPAKDIAMWDGTNWTVSTMEFGSTGSFRPVSGPAGDLYVAGDFVLPTEPPARNLARWDGSRWTAVPNWDDYNPGALLGAWVFGDRIFFAADPSQAGSPMFSSFGEFDDRPVLALERGDAGVRIRAASLRRIPVQIEKTDGDRTWMPVGTIMDPTSSAATLPAGPPAIGGATLFRGVRPNASEPPPR